MTSLGSLRTILTKAVTEHFTKLNSELEKLYAYSLYTSEDLAGIVAIANCETDITVSASDTEYNYYRYAAEEWKHFGDTNLFDELNTVLNKIMDCDQDVWSTNKQQILNACLEELVTLESSGLFGSKECGRFVAICVTDSEDPIMERSAKELNSEAIFQAYNSACI